ncbi:hypothetical protein Vafri_6642 [Volvox africanus]|uniref:Galactose oxidase-like Early set domain-containing protein n=1 Tax=Volvox africanus TaxID=51714 RepID=A0A8J4AZK1_9CHLO|nr:hypothetical protein Vafri_6642 [Volvox africanus]
MQQLKRRQFNRFQALELLETSLLLLLLFAPSNSSQQRTLLITETGNIPLDVPAAGSGRTMHRRPPHGVMESAPSSISESKRDASMATAIALPPGGGNGGGRAVGGRRLQQSSATFQGRTPLLAAATFEMGALEKAPVISIALAHVPKAGPRSRTYFAYSRARWKYDVQSAGTFDLDTREVNLITTQLDQFCNGPIVLADGNPALFGGYDEPKNKVQADGRKWISVYDHSQRKLLNMTTMLHGRWYPTPCMAPGNKVLIVGGTNNIDKGPQIPVAELWDPTKPHSGTEQVPLPPTFQKSSGPNWYPFVMMLPRGEILWWGDRGGSITDTNWNEIYIFPDLPNNTFPYNTMYPYTSSIVLHGLRPHYRTNEYNEFSITIFGGALNESKGAPATPASPYSARLDMYYCGSNICDKGWIIEDMMGQRRVMSTTTVLPNGKILVHGGGQAGTAGWKSGKIYKSTLPAYRDLMYNPYAPLGKRFSLSATLGIIRMYHSTSCLDLSGKVISAGCETCGMTGADAGDLPANVSRSPDGDLDYRISFAVPAEIGPGVERPVIISAPEVITRGSIFTVAYKGGFVTSVSMAAPCANTHSMNMNQRVLFLNLVSVSSSGVAQVHAPPLSQPAAAHAGYYQLFLLGTQTATGQTYSEGVWVQLVDAIS